MKLAERIFRRNDYSLTSPFGWRIHPVTKQQSFHSGTDYGTKGQKWNQYALENGVVLSAGVDRAGANALFAWVSYPRLGIKCLHYHLDQVLVKTGQGINANTIIGTTGTTGRSTGIHLHLGVKSLKTNVYFDPESYDYSENESGAWDVEFTKDLQRYFKTTVDGVMSGQRVIMPNVKIMRYGIFGSQLVRAMQVWLGVQVNGQLDKPTIRALQLRMGTVADGVISQNSALVREMRKRLKDGGL